MMSDTQFFILTPAYNCAQKIENTLKSVAFQTYKNWSMAVVDDTSTDNTKNSVLRLARQLGVSDRVKVIRREEKYGEVRNTLDVCLSLDDDIVVVRLDAGDWITDMATTEGADQDAWKQMMDMLKGAGGWPSLT